MEKEKPWLNGEPYSKTTEKPRGAELSRNLRGAISNGSKTDSRGDFMTSMTGPDDYEDYDFTERDDEWEECGLERLLRAGQRIAELEDALRQADIYFQMELDDDDTNTEAGRLSRLIGKVLDL